MDKDLKKCFESLSRDVKNMLADCDSPMMAGFAALALAQDECEASALSADEISRALRAAGTAVSERQIVRSFARAGNRISRRQTDDETYYRLMVRGRRQIQDLLDRGQIQVGYVEAGKPRTARQKLQEVFSKLQGDIRISDPYYGLRTLDTLELIPRTCKIRFLSARTNEKAARVNRAIYDFKRERPNAEFRIFGNPKELHDRYVISDDELIILGHGVKDIGNRESFVMVIGKDIAEGLHETMVSKFEQRWSQSSGI